MLETLSPLLPISAWSMLSRPAARAHEYTELSVIQKPWSWAPNGVWGLH